MPVFETHDGARLHYDVLGEGRSREPIVVLAGGVARHPEYLGDLAGLDAVRTLVVLHQRGVGHSQAAPLAGWSELAHDVEALRKHLDLGDIDVLGHSGGTRIALAYAARHPDRLHRLCLVTPPATWLVDAPDDRASLLEKRRGEAWFADYEKARPILETARTREEFLTVAHFAAPLGWAVWDERAQAHTEVGEIFVPAAEAYFAGAAEPGLADRLATVAAPVLVVAGAVDAVTGLEPVLALAKLFPGGRSVVIENAAHYPWIERPTDFRRAVDTFFT